MDPAHGQSDCRSDWERTNIEGSDGRDPMVSVDLDQFLDSSESPDRDSCKDTDLTEQDMEQPEWKLFKTSVSGEIAQYQLHRCSDARSGICRLLRSFCICLGFILCVALVIVAVYVMPPFADPNSGFWENWVFNAISHPIANLIIARGALLPAVKMLGLPPETASEVKKIVTGAACAAPVVCFLTHLAFHAAGIFPIPFAVPVSCQPAVLSATFFSYMLLPKEARDKNSRRALQFFVFFIVTCQGMIAVLLIASVYFKELTYGQQILAIFVFSGYVQGVCQSLDLVGRFFSMSQDRINVFKWHPNFVGLCFSASLMAEAKGTGVELTLVLLEATKAPQSVMKAFETLAALDADNAPETGTSTKSLLRRLMSAVSPAALKQSVAKKIASCRRVAKELRKIQGQLRDKTQQELNETFLSPEDAALLNHISAKLGPVAVLELSEMLAPVIYILITLVLQYAWTNNRSYFIGISSQTEDEVVQGMTGNAFGLAIEAGIFSVTALLSWRLLGVNFVELTASAILAEIDYWFFVSITVYMTYWTCLIKHTGHDFSFQFHWLP
ncbi:unnamed protein product [Symbiodinium natans]|uniref:Uncharacterized protein n=1 Tax=Symbiodinium natans TaxID=878477 RepID=A0A812JY53_9DINO|nr:unnamed protein product [Symbiodinium natans]